MIKHCKMLQIVLLAAYLCVYMKRKHRLQSIFLLTVHKVPTEFVKSALMYAALYTSSSVPQSSTKLVKMSHWFHWAGLKLHHHLSAIVTGVAKRFLMPHIAAVSQYNSSINVVFLIILFMILLFYID